MTQQKAVIKNMDHLGLIAGMIDELRIAESIDEAIPSSSKSKNLSYGEATKAMILNLSVNLFLYTQLVMFLKKSLFLIILPLFFQYFCNNSLNTPWGCTSSA